MELGTTLGCKLDSELDKKLGEPLGLTLLAEMRTILGFRMRDSLGL